MRRDSRRDRRRRYRRCHDARACRRWRPPKRVVNRSGRTSARRWRPTEARRHRPGGCQDRRSGHPAADRRPWSPPPADGCGPPPKAYPTTDRGAPAASGSAKRRRPGPPAGIRACDGRDNRRRPANDMSPRSRPGRPVSSSHRAAAEPARCCLRRCPGRTRRHHARRSRAVSWPGPDERGARRWRAAFRPAGRPRIHRRGVRYGRRTGPSRVPHAGSRRTRLQRLGWRAPAPDRAAAARDRHEAGTRPRSRPAPLRHGRSHPRSRSSRAR